MKKQLIVLFRFLVILSCITGNIAATARATDSTAKSVVSIIQMLKTK
ncbi:MAG: hypothetical protein HEQ35_18585 [Gloeotrichia echinulata IR180]|jgi:hypothetical protein